MRRANSLSKPRSTSRSTVALLERLDKIHGLSRRQRASLPRLFSITARFTKAKATRAALAERAPWLAPEWRPKYGPERNAIERDWKTRKTHHLADKTSTTATP
jgi:transposase